MIHINMSSNNKTDNNFVTITPRENSEESIANRLVKAVTKTENSVTMPSQTIANTQNWRSKDVDMKSDISEFAEEMDTESPAAKLIKTESKAMAKMFPEMNVLAKDIKKISEKNTTDVAAEPMETDELAAVMHAIKISEEHPVSEGVVINERFDRPMISIHKYDRIAPIPPSAKDFEGFFMVEVTAIHTPKSVYSVILSESKDAIYLFKHLLNVTYNDEVNNPTMQISRSDLPKYLKSLMIVKLDEQWTRCRLQQNDNEKFELEDIDTGKTSRFNMFLRMKKALEPEKMKSALSFKVKFENDPGTIAVGDSLKICMTNSNLYGISTARLDLQKTEVPIKEPKKVIASLEWEDDDEPIVEKEPPFMINRILVKSLPKTGKLKLNYVDGSRLEQGKMSVYESTDENKLFYEKLYDDIQAYIATHHDKNNYTPK